MESAAGLIKLKPDYAGDLEEWRQAFHARRDEVEQSLRDEGVAVESWFEIEIAGEPYLLWFMHARSIEKARQVFLNSTHDIDAFHLEKLTKIGQSQIEAMPVVDLSVDL